MSKELYEALAASVQEKLPADALPSTQRKIALLSRLCVLEGVVDSGAVKSSLLLIIGENHGIAPESILGATPPASKELCDSVWEILQAYQGISQDIPKQREVGLVNDVMILDEIGAFRLARVFQAWNGANVNELYQTVTDVYGESKGLCQKLQTPSGRQLGLERLRAMGRYCDELRDELEAYMPRMSSKS